MFLRLWTLKEAYIKARGRGLSIPLDGFAFSLQPDRPPAISFAEKCPDRPEDWQFAQIQFGRQHQIALAVRQSGQRDIVVTVRETVPLGRDGPQRILPYSAAHEWRL
jgi:4'-phosphopantetheinyl transferase